MKTRLRWTLCLATVLAFSCSVAPSLADRLQEDFATPPASARPWVYWFWLNGNITRAGITADLEAMKQVGIGGVLIMEVDQGVPAGPIMFMSPEWQGLFRHATLEAKRLGLEVNMNNDAGWNGSGGPWITPEQSMQKVVWSELNLQGPRLSVRAGYPTRGSRPMPTSESRCGTYQQFALRCLPPAASERCP